MTIIGKLFGAVGPAAPATRAAAETALPGYGAWYSHQMARSYARRTKLTPLRGQLLLAA